MTRLPKIVAKSKKRLGAEWEAAKEATLQAVDKKGKKAEVV